MRRKHKPINVGDRFTFLLVEKLRVSKAADNSYKHLCVCDCGRKKMIRDALLKSGNTRSCSKCSFAHKLRGLPGSKNPSFKHGLNKTKEHRAWAGMRKRCTNPKTKYYKNYGGRGIGIDSSWDTFDQFLKDMGKAPTPNHSLDRIDNSKGYSKENCRWATLDQQARNRRNNRLLTYKGEILCLNDWVKKFGLDRSVIRDRLKRGWSIEDTFEKPVRKMKKRIKDE